MVIAKYFHPRRRLFETGHVKMGRVQVGEKNSRSIHARSGHSFTSREIESDQSLKPTAILSRVFFL